jgi:hypothetical protein
MHRLEGILEGELAEMLDAVAAYMNRQAQNEAAA